MSGVIGLGIDVAFHEFDAGLAGILIHPIGRDQYFGMRVVCHRYPCYASFPVARPGMCFIMFEVYLNMLSGKIITPNPFLSRSTISRAPSKIRPELGPASKPSVWQSSIARV